MPLPITDTCNRVRCERQYKNLIRIFGEKAKYWVEGDTLGPLDWHPCGRCGFPSCSYHLITNMSDTTGDYEFVPPICYACMNELHPRTIEGGDWQI